MNQATAKTTEATQDDDVKKEGYDLTDIIPVQTECELADGEVVTLRPYTVRDAQWAMLKFGGEKGISSMFADVMSKNAEQQKQGITKVTQLLYHMMIVEDKKRFQYEERDEVDDDGKPVVIKVTGPERLMEKVRNVTDFACMINSILNCVGLSMPIRQAFEDATTVEGALAELKKKRRTGGESSTT